MSLSRVSHPPLPSKDDEAQDFTLSLDCAEISAEVRVADAVRRERALGAVGESDGDAPAGQCCSNEEPLRPGHLHSRQLALAGSGWLWIDGDAGLAAGLADTHHGRKHSFS